MMDEFYLVNQIKEKLCYVSMNFRADMMSCQCVRRSQSDLSETYDCLFVCFSSYSLSLPLFLSLSL